MRKLAFSTTTTLGAMLHERAAGPQGEDIRLLFAEGWLPPQSVPPRGDDKSIVFSYEQLYHMSCRAATRFRRLGVKPHDRILLFLSTGPAFLAAFYGCQLVGAVAVPLGPPRTLPQIGVHLEQMAQICEPALTVVGSKFMPLFRLARKRLRGSLRKVVHETELFLDEPRVSEPYPALPSDPAMIQFTSGSTANPKGVTLSHENLFANVRAIGVASEFRDDDVALCWLPLYHDMGLIGHMLNSALWRLGLVLMPPEVFISHPSQWLKALSRYRVSHSTAPNFAYLLCVRKIADSEIEGIDLSRWRLAYCGAEPVSTETIRRFTERFSPKGFSPTAFFPVYGLAEFTLAASFPTPAVEPRFDRIDRKFFEDHGIAQAITPASQQENALEWVSVGHGLPGHLMRIVDSSGIPIGERHVGEVELSGPSMMLGYYGNHLATTEVVRKGWLHTGDLGYMAEGDLFVTGRSKDLIIKAGRNIYPHDVEHIASRVPGVRPGCCAAFAITNEERGTDKLVLICETKFSDAKRRARLRDDIRAAVLNEIGTRPDDVQVVEPATVLKTSSGKIKRQAMRERYLRGELAPERFSFFQRARLYAEVMREQLRKVVFDSNGFVR
jgi:acyl-CoA synthetase (AMP-forming)/AMP-acid ligase II